ncbi:MAG: alanine--tRNA ligase [Planctomycetes bacterium]|jgi:alanyl-tRNA synthetase|nr:alanine--tRNA ligase [Planctomycetota bacterium]
MESSEVRKKFVDFYVSKNHKEISAAPLLAENDPTLLFVNSGMFPLVPYFFGEKHPSGDKLVNYQRSFRTDDIEEVGDARHTTFFEMLGNWSLGDYFKKEQLNYWYEFLIEVLGLDPKRIYQSVFAGDEKAKKDDESINTLKEIFKKYNIVAELGPETRGDGNKGPQVEINFTKYRIFPYLDKNWWKRGDAIGELGGPDSETFYDTGRTHNPKYGEYCHVNCDCGRFIEIGNSVFMQYKKTAQGWEELSQKNVDFGGGLERMTMAANGLFNVFKTDLFSGYIDYLEKRSAKKYEDFSSNFEVVSDHIRASVFLISDGGIPSNKDQGYFVRRLIRRALVHLRKLDIEFSAFSELAKLVIEKMSPVYPNLRKNEEFIIKNISEEVNKFSNTLEKGVKYFEKLVPVNNIITGEDVFNLFTTYGFPLEITEEMAKERNYQIDKEGFLKRINEHKLLSKQGSEQKFKSGLADTSETTIKLHTATHLLHEALRRVLGSDVKQKGSNITPERLRFDFFCPRKMTPEEITQVEELVNEQIQKNIPIYCEETTPEKAKNLGAIGLFDNKYGERVKVYSIGNFLESKDGIFSKEICSGPHVDNTGVLGHFKIIKEEASSAGIRRIKAIIE